MRQGEGCPECSIVQSAILTTPTPQDPATPPLTLLHTLTFRALRERNGAQGIRLPTAGPPPLLTAPPATVPPHAACPHACPCLQAPLVGGPAPDFAATAVFDQEFVDTTLSQYKVGASAAGLASTWCACC